MYFNLFVTYIKKLKIINLNVLDSILIVKNQINKVHIYPSKECCFETKSQKVPDLTLTDLFWSPFSVL